MEFKRVDIVAKIEKPIPRNVVKSLVGSGWHVGRNGPTTLTNRTNIG
jgi:hypothetical protein